MHIKYAAVETSARK